MLAASGYVQELLVKQCAATYANVFLFEGGVISWTGSPQACLIELQGCHC